MKPSEVSAKLRQIASTIDNSKNPRRNLVAADLKRIVVAFGGPLAQKLNADGVYPTSMGKGQVALFKDDDQGNEIDVTANYPDIELYIDEHPEGADRGGYVPWAEAGSDTAFYYGPDGEWA